MGCAFWYWVNELFEQKQLDSMRYRMWRYLRDLEDIYLLDDWYVSKARHTCCLVMTSRTSASFHRPCFCVDAVGVSGCSSPSTCLVSITRTSSASASFHRPWLRYVDARLAMFVRVSGCSSPRTRLLVSTTRTCSASAFFQRPPSTYTSCNL